MLGAIVGDVVGSIYEQKVIRTKDFPLFQPKSHFTDDTVLTLAIADAIIHQGDYRQFLRQYFRQYPYAGYGSRFILWAVSGIPQPYYSFGNGSAMRVSPVAYKCQDLDTVLQESQRAAAVTHNHPEGIKGAQAIAAAIFMARQQCSKSEIKSFITSNFHYDLSPALDAVPPAGVSCQTSVPQALIAFLSSDNFEDAIRNAIFIGGDSDTLACMTGAIAEPFYGGVPSWIAQETMVRLDDNLRSVSTTFLAQYGLKPC